MKRHIIGSRSILALAAALVLVAGAAGAEERSVDERAKADADGKVLVENVAGSIVVEGWDREEVHVTGTLGKDVEELQFKASGHKTRIEVKYPRRARSIDEGADLVIKVPAGSDVEVECVSCPVTVRGVDGDVLASSISGDVEVMGDARSVEAETISGTVDVDAPAAQRVSAESISGKVRARGGEAEVSGSVVNGELELDFERFTELKCESVNGDVTVRGDLARGAGVDIEVHSGDVTLEVPSGVSADFRIDTFSGDIENAFGQEAHRTSKYTPGKELEFTVGDGDARVRINTFSGDVVIRRL